VAAASHEILLFCDARQQFAPDVVRRLVAYFSDNSIGAVSGRLIILSQHSSPAGKGIGDYWNYEVWLRNNESVSGSVIGVTGAIYAMRKSLYCSIPKSTILDDVLIPLQIIKQGKRVVYDKKSFAYDRKAVTDSNELSRKVRTLYGNLQLLQIEPSLIVPFRNPVWFRFVSHKILRLLIPFFLGVCLLSSLFGGSWLLYIATAQVIFWCMAIICHCVPTSSKICNLLSGFLLLNLAVCIAWVKWIKKEDNIWC
jgi:cellulose synthase/poly-beta-1,6-N-acetylglucosamine synthase-like glycosyltransferase